MEEKKKSKIEKLNKDTEKAKTDLAKAKETTSDDMKKSYEDLELWKQKELAKGKDPQKVEKKYQRGLKIIDRLSERFDRYFDRMETRVDDWDYKGRRELEKSAHKKMARKIFTSSLVKIEKMLENDPNTELRYIIAGYCAISKKQKVNELQHPNIYREIQLWEKAITKASKDDEYFKAFLSFVDESDSKERKLKFKMNTATIVNEILERENISIRFLSEYTKIKYANLYNFLKKEIYSDLSFRRSHNLLWTTLNIKNGYSREEMFEQLKQKLLDNWEYEDIVKIESELSK